MINMTSEDIKLIEKFEKIMDDGYYVASDDVTRAYNRALSANASNNWRKLYQKLSDKRAC